jgi:hypothetical protein
MAALKWDFSRRDRPGEDGAAACGETVGEENNLAVAAKMN